MKKILILLILSLLIVFSFSECVFADGYVYVSADNSTLYSGDSFTVYVGLSCPDAIKSLAIYPSYDSDVLQLNDASMSWNIDADIKTPFNGSFISCAFSNARSGINQVVLTCTFTVKSNVPFGSTYISFTPVLKNLSENVGGSAGSVSVNIACRHSWGSGHTDLKETCTTNGQISYTCKVCGEKKYEVIPALGHNYGAWETVKDPTCTETGRRERTCSRCGHVDKTEIEALGHVVENGKETVAATCTEAGEAYGECTRCGEMVTVKTALAPHKWGEWTDTKAATCTENGERGHSCEVCGKYETQASLPLGHDYSAGEQIRQATIYSGGLFEATCLRCGVAGSVISPCSAYDEESGICFETKEGVFPSGTELHIAKVAEKLQSEEIPEYESPFKQGFKEWLEGLKVLLTSADNRKNGVEPSILDLALGNISSEYVVYEFTAKNGEEPVTPEGEYTAQLPIPEKFGRNVAVYSVDKNGNKTEHPLEIVYSAENDEAVNTTKVTLSDMPLLALVNLDASPKTERVLTSVELINYALELLLFILFVLFLVLFICKKPKNKKYRKKKAQVPADSTDISKIMTEAPEKPEISDTRDEDIKKE